MAETLTHSWVEYYSVAENPLFYQSRKAQSTAMLESELIDIEQQRDIDKERQSDDDDKLKTIDIYDYAEEEADNLFNQIIKAVALMMVIARCLPNFEHMMRKQEKSEFVNLIYCLPNRIFSRWSGEVDRVKDGLIAFLRDKAETEYESQSLKDSEILKILQWNAMSLLLDLYNISISYASKENTDDCLNNYPYQRYRTHSLQHLMILDNRSKADDFILEARAYLDSAKEPIEIILIRRVVSHALVFMKEISFKERQRLESSFFPKSVEQKQLLIQRSRSTPKE
jgi:hypothetical protein